ncbi:hypothetical protein [Chitinophaga sp. XS-30]|uniref:hypothetical protein n=1 Tax=Chitinophaga sp. XS-30 TaxID=2604421 RepID=UPI0011DD8763|nr:hypothetical protein [Chitinophaga sp. XS-30]QEH39910.1 hypothetical protein FW415_03120 [Chitinophaga sp. XS-30]
MLILKNRALGLSLLATAVFGITLASCSDDDPNPPAKRSKEYPLTVSTGTGGGKVTLQELTDSTFTMTIRIDKSTKDTTYNFVLFNGTKDTTVLDTFHLVKTVKSATTGAPVEAKWENVKQITIGETTKKWNYDSVLKYRAFARVAFVDKGATVKDSVVAIGNIGSAQ